jgi:hypothetical protein
MGAQDEIERAAKSIWNCATTDEDRKTLSTFWVLSFNKLARLD